MPSLNIRKEILVYLRVYYKVPLKKKILYFGNIGNLSSIHESSTGVFSDKLCGIDYCPSSTTPTQRKIQRQYPLDDQELHTRHILFSIFVGTATCGIIFAIVFLSSDLKDDNEEKNGSKNDARKKDSSRDDIKDKQQQELGLVDKLKEIFYLMKDTDLLKLIPLMMGVGAIHSFTYGDLTKVGFYLQLVEQNHSQNHSDGVLSNT